MTAPAGAQPTGTSDVSDRQEYSSTRAVEAVALANESQGATWQGAGLEIPTDGVVVAVNKLSSHDVHAEMGLTR